MTDKELMQQALEKLEFFSHMKSVSEDTMRLITALRERLVEQPVQQQEPVARVINKSIVWRPCDIAGLPVGTPLYTSPQPASKPLTDEQIEQCLKQAYATVRGRNLEHAFARAIEQAHGITGEQS